VWFNSTEDAVSNRYKPCPICKAEREYASGNIGRLAYVTKGRWRPSEDENSEEQISKLVGNENTGVYHCSSCSYIRQLGNNKVLFDSAKDAIDEGFKPCLVCKPELPEIHCPNCGALMLLRSGRYSKFYGCPNYPYDRYAISWEAAAEKYLKNPNTVSKIPSKQ
jgi:methylphosphotriester-DNA--protein-cysteine methyltransferase